MGTLRDMINGTYRLITVLGQNKRADESMIANALYALDTMQDSWSQEKLMIYSISPYIFYTKPGQKVYRMGPANNTPGSINEFQMPFNNAGSGYTDGVYKNVSVQYVTSGTGTGAKANVTINLGQIIDVQVVNYGTQGTCGINYQFGDLLTFTNTDIGGTGTGFVMMPASITLQTDWVIPRPMKIEKAYTILQTPQTTQPVDIPITLLTMEQYASITTKDTTSTFGFAIYDNNNYPTRDLTVFPVPQMSTGIRFWLREPLVVAERNQLDVEIDFPPGYERAFRYNLAIELAPEYMKSVPEQVTRTAMESKRMIAQLNQSPRYKQGDGSLSAKGIAGRWNWITGNFFYGGSGG